MNYMGNYCQERYKGMNSLVLLQLLLLITILLECVSAFSNSISSRTLSPMPPKSSSSRTKLFASSDNKYEDLIQWFTTSNEQSYITNKVDIRPSTRGGLETGGYGVFANDDLAEGELIFTIPKSCCVTLDDAIEDNECGDAFKQLMEKAGVGSDTVVLAGYVAKEYLLLQEYDKRISAGEKRDDNNIMRRLSKITFASYLRTLPWERGVNAQEHVLFWQDEDVDSLLKGSLAYEDAIEIRSTVKTAVKILDGIISPVVRKARGEEEESTEEEGGFLFPWQSKEEEKPKQVDKVLDGLEDAVQGAMVISLTRAFAVSDGDGKEEDRLEPILDMLQHSGKSALVLFYHVNSCVQYKVLVILVFHPLY